MDKMTETEVKAEAMGIVLQKEPTTFGQEQCELAMKRVSALAKAGQADDETCDRTRAWLGNHSAVRQWAVKQGFIPAPTVDEDALAKAVKKVIGRIDKALDEIDVTPKAK